MKKILMLCAVLMPLALRAAPIGEAALGNVTTLNPTDKIRVLSGGGANSRIMTVADFVKLMGTNGIADTNFVVGVSNTLAAANTNLLRRPWLVFEGDSMTTDGIKFGDAVPTGPGNDWPTQMKGLSNFKNFGLYTNFAQNGANAFGLPGEYASQGQTKRPNNTNFDNAFYFVWAGVNDLRSSNSAGSIYANLSNVWRSARIDGFSPVAMTIPNFSAANGSNATVEAIRTSLNTLIKGDRAQYDFLVDADALFPDLSSKFDGLHLSTAGNLALGQWINTNMPLVKPMFPQWGGNHYAPANFISVDPGTGNSYLDVVLSLFSQNLTAHTDFGWNRISGNVDLFIDPTAGAGHVGINKSGSGLAGSAALQVYGGATTSQAIEAQSGNIKIINAGDFINTAGGVYVTTDISGAAIRANSGKFTNGASNKAVFTSDAAGLGTWALPYALQEVRSVSNALFTGSSVAVFDDTTLSLPETTNVLSVTITPLRSDTFIIVEAVVNFGITTSAKIAAGIWRDANATATSVHYCSAGGIWSNQIKLYTKFPSTSTASTQFNVRMGSDAGTFYVNGLAGARVFGGTSESWIVAREVSQ